MAGTAPTGFEFTRKPYAGPVHCSVWLSTAARGRKPSFRTALRVAHEKPTMNKWQGETRQHNRHADQARHLSHLPIFWNESRTNEDDADRVEHMAENRITRGKLISLQAVRETDGPEELENAERDNGRKCVHHEVDNHYSSTSPCG